MRDQKYFGHLCQLAKNCPVYQETLIVDRISLPLLKNVFCNRGYNGWKNCERFKLADEGLEISATATPYTSNVEILS